MASVLQNIHAEEDFNWLKRTLRGPTYTSFSQFSHLPYCSFEWGANGYAGCSNHAGELMYLSKPSASKGLIIARGHSAPSLYASLAHSQIDFGGPSTFGLKVTRSPYAYDRDGPMITQEEMMAPKWTAGRDALGAGNGTSFCLGSMIDRGCFNYRWPVTEYSLNLHPNQESIEKRKKNENHQRRYSAKQTDVISETQSVALGESVAGEQEDMLHGKQVGTCQMLSCTKNGIFYQILRVEELPDVDVSFPIDSQIVLTIGGPVWFQSFSDGDDDLVASRSGTMTSPFSLQRKRSQDSDSSDEDSSNEERVTDISEGKTTMTATYWERNKNNEGRGLEARVYQFVEEEGYRALPLFKSEMEIDNGPDSVQGLTVYNAVAELKNLPRPMNQTKSPRSGTFLATIRLFEGGKKGIGSWPKLPTSKDFYDYLGVNPLSRNATGTMWERIFLDRRTYRGGQESVLDFAELHMIGRSLEKILQVDIIPAAFYDDEVDQHQTSSALVSNLFIQASVDLEALFWKTRFLVRTHGFLSHIQESKAFLAKQNGKEKVTGSIEEYQIARIRSSVESIVRYLVKALLEPSRPRTRIMPDHDISGGSSYFYVMMTIWYVWRSFKDQSADWTFDWVDQLQLAGDIKQTRPPLLLARYYLPPDTRDFPPAERNKVKLLQWYHYGSLLKLCQEVVLPYSWLHAHPRLIEKERILANEAKMVSLKKLSAREPYVAEDEIFDRLSFLADELCLESLSPNDVGRVAWLSMKRIRQREFTYTLNPGWKPRGVEETTSGPWEIYALCHHSRLIVLTKEEKSIQDLRTRVQMQFETEDIRQKICGFLNAEGTLIPCWERPHARRRWHWLRSETTAIVASTLINILEKSIRVNSDSESASITASKRPQTEIFPSEESTEIPSRALQIQGTHLEHEKLLQQPEQSENYLKGEYGFLETRIHDPNSCLPIQWESFRLPLVFYPVSFFNSLKDMPELYMPEALSKIPIPLSLQSQNHVDWLRISREINKAFRKQDLVEIVESKLLSLHDITVAGKQEDDEGFIWEIKTHQYDDSKITGQISNEKFCWALYDNLVDQEIQHRFLTVKPLRELGKLAIPKKIVEMLVYVVHPESASCLGYHIINFSNFTCNIGDTWIAGITLKSWQVEYEEGGNRSDSPSQNPSSDDPFRIPNDLSSLWQKLRRGEKKSIEKMIFKPEMSSIVISTNAFGDFSKCTLVTALIGDKQMGDIVEEARKLWQKFIHQPQTARCLVFLLLLGRMCQKIADQYKKAIETVISFLELNNTANITDKEWYTGRFGIHLLKLTHWSMDSLLKLEHNLNATVDTITEAKEEFMAQIRDGPGKRSLSLERMCQGYEEDFESSLGQLHSVKALLERSVKLNMRNEKTMEVESETRDRVKSINQASTIERLTYLTILYLPINLVAAIYAIPGEHKVLFENMGLQWFLYSILIVSTTTYILAFYIKDILEIFSGIFTGVFEALRVLFFGLLDCLPNSLTSWLNIPYLAFSKSKIPGRGKRWRKNFFGGKSPLPP